jgi:hypothetical protein
MSRQRAAKAQSESDVINPNQLRPATSSHWAYGWFTEGLDTADLQEVKALLLQMSQPVLR